MKHGLRALLAGAAVAFAGSLHGLAAQETLPTNEENAPDTVVFTRARLGTVTFAHADHGERIECATCHHESKEEKPLTMRYQACADCHLEPEAPMTTGIDVIFHVDRAESGLCVDCHATEAENGTEVPQRCRDCHIRDAGGDAAGPSTPGPWWAHRW